MKKDDFSLIRSGLASELYLLFFLKTDSTYEHAKIIKKTKQVPDVSKVYLARDRLEDQGFIEKRGLRYYPVIEKLAKSLSYLLIQKGKRLTKTEFQLLCILLRNIKMAQILTPVFVKKITKQPTGTHNIDALDLIAKLIGNLAFGSYLFQTIPHKYTKFIPKQRTMSFEEIENEVKEIEITWNKIMENFDRTFIQALKEQNVVLPDYVVERIILIMKSMPVYPILYDKRFISKLSALGDVKESIGFINTLSKHSKSKSK